MTSRNSVGVTREIVYALSIVLLVMSVITDVVDNDYSTIPGAFILLIAIGMGSRTSFEKKGGSFGQQVWILDPHLVLAVTYAAWHNFILQDRQVEGPFSLEPVGVAFGIFLVHLILAFGGVSLKSKLGVTAIFCACHTFRPIFGIGWREQVLIVGGSLVGLLCGSAVVEDAGLMAKFVEMAEANRRSDSRLNHVIKG